MASKRHIATRVAAVIIFALGAPMIWMGGALAVAGGTLYYLCAGVLMVASAIALFRTLPLGFTLFTGVLLLTLGWAVYEAGNSFWLVGSRIWIIGLLWLFLCLPLVRRQLWPLGTPKLFALREAQIGGAVSAAVLIAMVVDLVHTPVVDIPRSNYQAYEGEREWYAYGASNAGTRYAPHEQIDATNVHNLTQIWEAETGQVGRFSATPIQVGNSIYLCTAQNIMIALDADTGEEQWRFDPGNDTPPYGILGNCRGVTYYAIPGRAPDQVCAERIYTATTDARMIAVDRNTGETCGEFGENGQISLLAGMGEVKPFYYFVTSPATVASGALVVGGWVMDNQEVDEPSGVVRGYDPVTGELKWAWDIGREGQTGLPPEGGYYTRGTPNVWSLTSADDELGLVYVPTGNATPDYFGGHRTEIMNKYASSIVAIDANTGLTRWHFQTTHNDIWDYDVPSQPTLVDLKLNGDIRKAVIVPTKRGETFLLDRLTGEPIADVAEVAVPQTDLPQEKSSPTQPFSTGMPSFAYPRINESDLFGITPFDQMACRTAFKKMRYEGPMTPPSEQGTLLYPGPAGGQNWGSVAVDPVRQLMVVNNMHLPFHIHMVPREKDLVESGEGRNRGYGIGGPQRGTPFAAKVQMFSSPLGMPCLKPPYGEIAVVDLTTQQLVWKRGMGLMELGFPYSAGSFVTASGLIFNAGVMDGQLRVFDIYTGEVIWQTAIPSGSDATPMSYVSPESGRQFILVTVPGAGRPQPAAGHDASGEGDAAQRQGGRVIAYALPSA